MLQTSCDISDCCVCVGGGGWEALTLCILSHLLMLCSAVQGGTYVLIFRSTTSSFPHHGFRVGTRTAQRSQKFSNANAVSFGISGRYYCARMCTKKQASSWQFLTLWQLRMRYTWHLRMSVYSLYFQDADMHRFSATNQAHDARTSFRFS
jgi:hypothetical protein